MNVTLFGKASHGTILPHGTIHELFPVYGDPQPIVEGLRQTAGRDLCEIQIKPHATRDYATIELRTPTLCQDLPDQKQTSAIGLPSPLDIRLATWAERKLPALHHTVSMVTRDPVFPPLLLLKSLLPQRLTRYTLPGNEVARLSLTA